jgi:hypothetical protein
MSYIQRIKDKRVKRRLVHIIKKQYLDRNNQYKLINTSYV